MRNDETFAINALCEYLSRKYCCIPSEIIGEPLGNSKPPDYFIKLGKQTISVEITQPGYSILLLNNTNLLGTPIEGCVERDPEFDTKRAKKKLRKYVESQSQAIREKAEIMLVHFHDNVIGQRKIGSDAQAMVASRGIKRTIQYFHEISDYLHERKSPYKAIVAFSGEHKYGGRKVNESSLNGFLSSQIEEKLREDSYRSLVVANKFLTGFDEPLLLTMHVDKPLSGIKAVQFLLRLNRDHPKKDCVFVLDFANSVDSIRAALSDYYRTPIFKDEAAPYKLHNLKAELDGYQNAIKNSNKQNARIEHNRALGNVMLGLLSDHTELFSHFIDDPNFKRFLSSWMFDHILIEKKLDFKLTIIIDDKGSLRIENTTWSKIWNSTYTVTRVTLICSFLDTLVRAI